MRGFESPQMNIDFNSGERPPEVPRDPELGMERKKAAALGAIKRVFPKENIEELHLVTPEGRRVDGETLIFRRPPDTYRYLAETFFQVNFNDKGEAAEVLELPPLTQPHDDVVKRGRRAV